jgi:hypothetical protein
VDSVVKPSVDDSSGEIVPGTRGSSTLDSARQTSLSAYAESAVKYSSGKTLEGNMSGGSMRFQMPNPAQGVILIRKAHMPEPTTLKAR